MYTAERITPLVATSAKIFGCAKKIGSSCHV